MSEAEIALLDNVLFSAIKEDVFGAPSPVTPSFTVKFVDFALMECTDELKTNFLTNTTEDAQEARQFM